MRVNRRPLLGALGVTALVLIGGAIITGWTFRLLVDAERERQRVMLAGLAEQSIGEIRRRFNRYEIQLVAARALFAGSTFVSRDEWREFARFFLPTGDESGLFELAWVPRVTRDELQQIAASARADGLGDFAVYPAGERNVYCPILYNEPQHLHVGSLGRDVCVSDPARPAMQRARQEDGTFLSDPLRLGTDDSALVPGYVLFAWVEGNQQRHSGWVAGTATTDELLGVHLPGQRPIDLTVTDQSVPGGETVYRTTAFAEDPTIRATRTMMLGGRDLQLHFAHPVAVGLTPWLALGTGTAITLLLAGFLLTLLRTRARALLVAERMSRAWRQSEDLLKSITNNIQEGIYRGVPGKGLVYVNQALADMFGFDTTREMMAHAGPVLYAYPEQREELERLLDRHGYYRNQEVVFLRRDGSRFVAVNSTVATRDARGRIRYFDGVVSDITERKQAEEQVHRLAHYDALTGLPNRRLFGDLVEQALNRARRAGRPVAFMFMDLDRFKMINDSLGHSIGDHLLTAVAERLSAKTRNYDIISRQGGDEFSLVLPDADAGEAARKAESLLTEFGRNSFRINGHELAITPSIGIAMHPDDGDDAEALLRCADAAMYHAKECGRATFRFFTPELNTRAHERLRLESHLRHALAGGELSLAYQPIISLADGEVAGAEALLRWHNATLGQVSPADFIPVAEQSGLIVEIGDWVISQACRQLAEWRERGLGEVSLSVNVSAVQFWRGNLDEVVKRSLSRWQVDPSLLTIELTESVIMQNAEAARDVLAELKLLGLKLAIDDFGTGYSSLSYLKQFRIDQLKIDRSFVRDVAQSADDAAIVAAVLSMATDLRMQVVAEGIENPEQLDYLRARHCHFGQGFLFSPAVPAEDVPGVIEQLRCSARGAP